MFIGDLLGNINSVHCFNWKYWAPPRDRKPSHRRLQEDFLCVFSALMEPVQLKVGVVTKTTVTVVWVWQRKAGPIRVNRYRVMLTKESESESRFSHCCQKVKSESVDALVKSCCFFTISLSTKNVHSSPALSLWPDQWQLTFNNLKPNTEYSLLLLADDVSRNIILVRTDFSELNWFSKSRM